MDYGRFIFFSFKTDHPIGGMCDVLCHFNNHNEAKEQLNNRKKLINIFKHDYFELFDCQRREVIMHVQGNLPVQLVVDVVKTAEELSE
ncbi:hypothetical protein J41TS2_24720 [Bacillus sonorensis]|uniref:hypothetical protein n=1 Tax=Bacillus sonorensis TaxID=119858 RepID=UPI001B1709A1|nr:hypothetical protein [Bacillus sonorensis]GIN67051.1 hypothetical protein J41TS2_24720 [Bacillus sonorensis]